MNNNVQETGAWRLKPDVMSDMLEQYSITDRLTANDFLHGSCAIFALVLHDLYRYPIHMLLDDAILDEEPACQTGVPWPYMVHVYTMPNGTRQTSLYADVRGITPNISKFCEEFADFFTVKPVITNEIEPERLRTDLERYNPGKNVRNLYTAAKTFISEHPDWFKI